MYYPEAGPLLLRHRGGPSAPPVQICSSFLTDFSAPNHRFVVYSSQQIPPSQAAHMWTASPVLWRTNLLRPKYLLFGFIGLMLAYVLVNNERFLIDSSDPEWA